jgi:RING finger and CHY zinc finger domain-containing protein 1
MSASHSSTAGSEGSDQVDDELAAHLRELEEDTSDTSWDDDDSDEDGAVAAVATTDTGPSPLGCQHYLRGAKLVAPCCGGIFWCRLCHDAVTDEGEPDPKKQHKINRFAITECVCGACGLRQEVQQVCSGCGLVMGAYFCKICKFWENKDRKQFHCNECGICRFVVLFDPMFS